MIIVQLTRHHIYSHDVGTCSLKGRVSVIWVNCRWDVVTVTVCNRLVVSVLTSLMSHRELYSGVSVSTAIGT